MFSIVRGILLRPLRFHEPDRLVGEADIWIEDLTDGSIVRLAQELSLDVLPVWSPDGRRIAYGSGTRADAVGPGKLVRG